MTSQIYAVIRTRALIWKKPFEIVASEWLFNVKALFSHRVLVVVR
jgi:hypothetical protein